MSPRILVSVGTHEQPFQRLLDAVEDVVQQGSDARFVVQYGVGRWSGIAGVEAVQYFDHSEMQRQLDAADILVTQASPGNVFGALKANAWPLVLGRAKAHQEHVDDHQIQFAAAVDDLGLGTNVGSADLLASILAKEMLYSRPTRTARCERAVEASDRRASIFHQRFWEQLGDVMGGQLV